MNLGLSSLSVAPAPGGRSAHVPAAFHVCAGHNAQQTAHQRAKPNILVGTRGTESGNRAENPGEEKGNP